MKNKIILVNFLGAKELNYRFTKWPNHITLVPYFYTDNLELLDSQLNSICNTVNSIKYTVGEIDYFGGERNLKVSKIKSSEALLALHISLLEVAKNHDKHIDLTYCGKHYTPHITHNEATDPENCVRTINKIYLIRNVKEGTKEKEIIKTYILP